MADSASSRPTPQAFVRKACARLGEAEVARRSAALVSGSVDLEAEEDFLRAIGFRGEMAWLLQEPNPYWARVWGARALRYCWGETAPDAVLEGLHDDAWRVVEHCAVIVADRELPDAAPTLVTLTRHPVPRVRVASVRALSRVGEREDVPAVLQLADDPERKVQIAVERALPTLRDRLDLPAEAVSL